MTDSNKNFIIIEIATVKNMERKIIWDKRYCRAFAYSKRKKGLAKSTEYNRSVALMQEKIFNHINILKRSGELKLSFSDTLGGAVLEDIVYRIGSSEYGERLWLRNRAVLGEEQYKNKLILHLEYVYAPTEQKVEELKRDEKEPLSELAAAFKESVFFEEEDADISYSQSEIYSRGHLQLQITAQIEDMQVPVSMGIHLLYDEEISSVEESFCCMMDPEIIIFYHSIPVEWILVENFIEIITKMELIVNIGAYYEIYSLLDRENLDTRKIKEDIAKQCNLAGLERQNHYLETIDGYRDYTYMKKKWKVFLRSIRSGGPSWESVMDRFLKFFEPVWKAVVGEYVFFGDWMPELNRFL